MKFALLAVLISGFVAAFAETSVEENPFSGYENDVESQACRPNGIPSTIGCCYAKTYKYLWIIKIPFFSCISMRALPYHNTARLIYALNHRHVYDHIISLKTRRIEICKKIPKFVRHLTSSKICLVVTNINYRKRLVCARLHGYFKLPLKTYHVHHSWGCFKLPHPTESDTEFSPDNLDATSLESELSQVDSLDEIPKSELDLGDDDLDPEYLSSDEAKDEDFMFDEY